MKKINWKLIATVLLFLLLTTQCDDQQKQSIQPYERSEPYDFP